MDVRHPISAVVPSLDGLVLQALDRTTEPLTLTAIQELSGAGSISGVKRTLARLADQGVVHSLGTPPRYSLNRDHVTYPAITFLASLRAEVLDRIKELIEAWDTQPDLVGVFGSFARGDGDTDSDIDILLIGDIHDDQVAELAGQIFLWTGNPAQVVDLTYDEYATIVDSDEPVAQEWQRDLIVVTEDLMAHAQG